MQEGYFARNGEYNHDCSKHSLIVRGNADTDGAGHEISDSDAFEDKEVNGMEGYCVKCKAKREMKDAKAVVMKNGKPATSGTCPTCGTKMFKIGKA